MSKQNVNWNIGGISGDVLNLEVYTENKHPHTEDEIRAILLQAKSETNGSAQARFSPKYAISFPYAFGWDGGYMVLFTNSDRYMNGVGHPFECEGERKEYRLQ